jgi:hypothetical protein
MTAHFVREMSGMVHTTDAVSLIDVLSIPLVPHPRITNILLGLILVNYHVPIYSPTSSRSTIQPPGNSRTLYIRWEVSWTQTISMVYCVTCDQAFRAWLRFSRWWLSFNTVKLQIFPVCYTFQVPKQSTWTKKFVPRADLWSWELFQIGSVFLYTLYRQITVDLKIPLYVYLALFAICLSLPAIQNRMSIKTWETQ